LRCRHPGHEQREQQRAQPEHRSERGRAQYIERIPCAGTLAALAAAAQFVQAEGSKRAGQRKPGGQRKQQRQHGITKHRARQHQSEHRVDRTQHQGVARNLLEILPAEPQRAPEVCDGDGADRELGRDLVGRPNM
jgi:hypothetical protein